MRQREREREREREAVGERKNMNVCPHVNDCWQDHKTLLFQAIE
jgi:hypothetical protein